MSRPKSELTGQRPHNFSVRFTEAQHIMFLRLGGSKWLRQQLDVELEKQRAAKGVIEAAVRQSRGAAV